jgi:hypothetical protein
MTEQITTIEQLKSWIGANNNTRVFEMDGEIYIDSLNRPHVFQGECEYLGHIHSVEVLNKPTDVAVLRGDKKSGFVIKGYEFLGYAYKVEVLAEHLLLGNLISLDTAKSA